MNAPFCPVTGDSFLTYNLIKRERIRQHDKWYLSDTGDCSNPNMPNDTRFRILAEEVGEVAAALNDGESIEHLIDELVQVAAVAVAWIEGLTRDE